MKAVICLIIFVALNVGAFQVFQNISTQISGGEFNKVLKIKLQAEN